MAYRKPFTLQQRREAMTALRSYLKHLRLLRRRYRPTNEEQRDVLDRYADVVASIQAILAGPDRTVDVDSLNRSDAVARWLAMEYWRLRNNED